MIFTDAKASTDSYTSFYIKFYNFYLERKVKDISISVRAFTDQIQRLYYKKLNIIYVF